MAFEFLEAGQYKVILGKSFDARPKKKAPKYFNVKSNQENPMNKDSTDLRAYGNEAKLEKKKDRYQVEMKHNNSPNMIYDAEVSTEEEFNCILIYNEEKKTITIERQSAEISLTRKKIETPLPNGHLNHSPLPGNQYTPTTIHTPPIVSEPIKEVVTPITVPVSSPSPPPPPAPAPVPAPPVIEEDVLSAPDDDEFDLSKDLDEILDSDDDDDDDEQPPPPQDTLDMEDDDSESDQFEEIIAPTSIPPVSVPSPMNLPMSSSLPPSPNIPLSLALPGTPSAKSVPASSPSAAKKRKFKMASAPIRHPGVISPLATTSPINQANKRLKTESGYSSSSGSEESSSGSESGSTESSSGESDSESGSSSDDDDFESLAQDISLSLSKGGPSAPASPQRMDNMISPSNYKRSPYDITPGNTPTPSTRPSAGSSNSNGASAPMSLRALFKEDDEEEGLSSSSEDDDDD